jgi:hypothetical protein
MPQVKRVGDRLLVAYVCRNPKFPGWDSGASPNHPGFDVYSAILEFSGVKSFTLGAPSDEKVHEHPLYAAGLKPYGFHEIIDGGSGTRRWIITFHDETLDVSARAATVLKSRVEGEDTDAILTTVA